MLLLVFLVPYILILLLLFISFRINIELIASETGITYTVKGSLLKVIKLFEVKSGEEAKGGKSWQTDEKEQAFLRKRVFGILWEAMVEHKGKVLHIEKLSVNGTFSIEDAAANALLYGLFMALWQFLLIFLAANFTLENQCYHFMPDFRHDRNELIFHAIFRILILHVLMLVIHNLIEARKKK